MKRACTVQNVTRFCGKMKTVFIKVNCADVAMCCAADKWGYVAQSRHC